MLHVLSWSFLIAFQPSCFTGGVLGSGQDKPTADVDQLSLSFSQLQAALEQAHAYVESVVVRALLRACLLTLATIPLLI